MSKQVLLIEDDHELGAQVRSCLGQAGYGTHWLQTGRLLRSEDLRDFDLVILDIMLPGVFGLDILKALRNVSDLPVLVLSARNETSDKVRALKLGADDYLTKPFWPEELLERVRARLRRPSLDRQRRVESVGDVRIDCEGREVFVRGERVELTRSEFDVLALLAERPGAAVTRRALMTRVVSSERDASERALDVHVSRIRKKLGTDDVVETVRGIGYRLKIRDSA